MTRALTIAIAMFFVGCGDRDKIALKTALENTENGEYRLIAISEMESKFVSFQKAVHHKKQYYYQDDERDAVFRRGTEAVVKGRKNGHEIATMGLYPYLEE